MGVSPAGLDLVRLRAYLDSEAPGLVGGELTGEVIAGGRSNLTYRISDGARDWVVRRPPLGHVLATAHDMGREYRVLSALAGTDVPVPGTVLLCTDPEVVGAPFYVMERVEGTVYRSPELTAGLGPERARRISEELIDTLAALHGTDPASVGLGDFGHPEGFLHRQVRRWRIQLDASRSRPLDGIDELAGRLAAAVPESGPATIVHGDYRLDNAIVAADGSLAAVLDWEMATLGDPLTDLGLFSVYWTGAGPMPGNPITKGVRPEYGFPDAPVLLARYASLTGADLSGLGWYTAFGYFKLAVIVEGVHYRYTQGQTVGEGFEEIGAMTGPLVKQGLATIGEG
jgi:aminoglycoside phosphotransferase (APT) family kinase protein